MSNQSTKTEQGNAVLSYALSQSQHQPVVITISTLPRVQSPLALAVKQANKDSSWKAQ